MEETVLVVDDIGNMSPSFIQSSETLLKKLSSRGSSVNVVDAMSS